MMLVCEERSYQNMDIVMIASPTALDSALHGKNYNMFNDLEVDRYDLTCHRAHTRLSKFKHNTGATPSDPVV